MKLAIIVPYRDRRDQLDVFIPHMEKFLTNKQIDYKIFVAEQSDDRPFNYGKLCNVIVNEIKEEYDYFCFHDVDLLPLNDDADYSYKDKPTSIVYENEDEELILPYDEYFGGVIFFTKEDFIKVNGYSNDYWGKGYIDLDLLYRCLKNELTLVKKYNYDINSLLKLNLKNRKIVKSVSKIDIKEKSIIITQKSNVISKNFTLTFHYKQNIKSNSKVVLFRTFNGHDFQIFVIDGKMIIQFFEKEEIYQIDIDEIDTTKLNHYSIIHDFDSKEFTIYYNNKMLLKRKYNINYDYSLKNVILGDIDNTKNVEFIDFKLFTKKLTKEEVLENYYYGLESNCLEFNKLCFFENFSVILDRQFNTWEMVAKTTKENEGKKIGETYIIENKPIVLNESKNIINKLKGKFKNIGNKFDEIEDTFNPYILENKRSYFDDLLNDKININKYGLKSVKYTLLNKITFNENTEWYKISI